MLGVSSSSSEGVVSFGVVVVVDVNDALGGGAGAAVVGRSLMHACQRNRRQLDCVTCASAESCALAFPSKSMSMLSSMLLSSWTDFVVPTLETRVLSQMLLLLLSSSMLLPPKNHCFAVRRASTAPDNRRDKRAARTI